MTLLKSFPLPPSHAQTVPTLLPQLSWRCERVRDKLPPELTPVLAALPLSQQGGCHTRNQPPWRPPTQFAVWHLFPRREHSLAWERGSSRFGLCFPSRRSQKEEKHGFLQCASLLHSSMFSETGISDTMFSE